MSTLVLKQLMKDLDNPTPTGQPKTQILQNSAERPCLPSSFPASPHSLIPPQVYLELARNKPLSQAVPLGLLEVGDYCRIELVHEMGLAPCSSDLFQPFCLAGSVGTGEDWFDKQPRGPEAGQCKAAHCQAHSTHIISMSLEEQEELIRSICAPSQHRRYFYYMAPTVSLVISSEVYESPARVT